MQGLSAIGFLFLAGLLTSLPGCTKAEVDEQVNVTVERSEPTPSPTPNIAAENFRKEWEREFETMKNEIEALENGRMVTADYDKNLGYPKFVWISISYGSHFTRSITLSKLARAE